MNKNSLCSHMNKIKEINLLISPSRRSQFILKINLDKGKTETINIYQNSNAEEIAYNFCLKNNLDYESVKQLIKKIKQLKDNNFLSDKENISLSSNIIKSKKSSQSSSENFNLNNKKYINKKSVIYNSNNISMNTNINDDIENNRKTKEINTTKKILINSNNITPINHVSIYSKNNITSDKNLNIFNFLSPKESNNDLLTNNNSSNINKIINDNNIKLDYSKKTSTQNSNNNSIWTFNFNDSINDKLNNLEKAYASFNPKNKKVESENENMPNNEHPENTKEIISEAIKNCLNMIEKEEFIDNKSSEAINESIFSITKKNTELKDKKLSNEKNNVNEEMIENISILEEKNKGIINVNLKNSFITPKDKKINDLNIDKLTEDNNNLNAGIINENLHEVDLLKKSLISKNNVTVDDNKSINEKFFENKDDKMNIEKDIEIKDFTQNNYSNNKKLIPKIPINNNNIINIDNLNHNHNKYCLNNNYNIDYYDKQFEKDNNSNLKEIDNNIIKKEINFSLLTNKNNFTISYSHKDFNNKKSFRRVLQKNQAYCRSYREKEKKFEIIGFNINKNSIKVKSNSNSISYNNINKDTALSDSNDIYNIKRINNFSSLKTIINNENEKKVIYSPLKMDKSLNKCCLLSFTRSEQRMANVMNKNSKNKDNHKDNINNRTTITSMGKYTYSNSTITRGSTNMKLINHKNLINYNILKKIPLNQTFNFSNELLFKRQKEKEKENNRYYNKTINLSHNLDHNNFINNKKSIKSNKSYKVNKINNRKNKRLIILSNLNLNLNNSIKTNYSPRNKDNSPDYLKQKTKSNLSLHYKNISQMKIKKKYNNNPLNKNSLSQNLLAKKEIITSIKNIFYYISKNNDTLDAFAVVNKNNIPEKIYDIIKKIVNNCDKKKRFIEYNEFINQAFYLFDSFSKEDKITILNFK